MSHPPKTAALTDEGRAREFYEDRYKHGYMEDWAPEKKQRVADLIRSLGLPATGRALDYGCGNGVFTAVLRQALPSGWSVAGTDISAVAVENAAKRAPDCEFFVGGGAPGPRAGRFDFIFSHHVLEHVYDLDPIFDEMAVLAAPAASMLHIMPCGNPGSFEANLVALRTDGINPAIGNRFFYEDEGHVRRMTSQQLADALAPRGFVVEKAFFANQCAGAMQWITEYGRDFILTLTDPAAARDAAARAKLLALRAELLRMWRLRFLGQTMSWDRLRKPSRSLSDYLAMLVGFPLYYASKPADARIRRAAREEWQTRNTEPNGSEMYLYLRRGNV